MRWVKQSSGTPGSNKKENGDETRPKKNAVLLMLLKWCLPCACSATPDLEATSDTSPTSSLANGTFFAVPCCDGSTASACSPWAVAKRTLGRSGLRWLFHRAAKQPSSVVRVVWWSTEVEAEASWAMTRDAHGEWLGFPWDPAALPAALWFDLLCPGGALEAGNGWKC